MTWLDRLLGRQPQNNYHLTVTAPATPAKPHNFCSHCGEPMVEGYLIYGRAFDQETGQPNLKVLRRRLCLSLHKQEVNATERDDTTGEDKHNPQEDHDGFPIYGLGFYWGMGMGIDPYDYIPDCEPRKASA